MWFWPNLQLTEYEKKYVRMYKEDKFPGVLRRVYNLQLASEAQTENNIPAARLIDKYQVARRSRIFAISFSGNPDAWRLKVTNSNGTLYTNPAPRSQQFPIVTSLVAGSYYNALAQGGMGLTPLFQEGTVSIGPSLNPSAQFMTNTQSFPWIIEPNWVCQPNESIIFEGTKIATVWHLEGEADLDDELRSVLNISVYAWEFPGMSC